MPTSEKLAIDRAGVLKQLLGSRDIWTADGSLTAFSGRSHAKLGVTRTGRASSLEQFYRGAYPLGGPHDASSNRIPEG